MAELDERKEEDPFAEWDLCMPLIADDADDAGFRIKNHPRGENHRIYLTGYDRPGATAVRGRLFHVVHGTLVNSSNIPATLIVFEWLLIPGKLGKRFREVEIDVTFFPHGRRPGTMPGDDLSEYTPQVRHVAPNVPAKSYIAGREITTEKATTMVLRAGYKPFVALTGEASQKKTEKTQRTDYRFVAGYSAFVDKIWGEPNSVHWTLQENAPQESGTPHLVRTAVLLQRASGDSGPFRATIKTSARVSVLVDAAEKLRKAVGLIPKDDPVNFDPRPVPGDTYGAAVLDGKKDGLSNQRSLCDKDSLDTVDLTQFLVVSDGEQWRVAQKGASMADEGQPPIDPVEEMGWDLELGL